MSRRLLSCISSYVVYQSTESSRRDSHQFHFWMSERACSMDYWSCIPTTAGALSLEWRSVHVITLAMAIVFRTWTPCYWSLLSERSVPNPITIPVGSCLLQCPVILITLCQKEPQAFTKPWLLSSQHWGKCLASCLQNTSCSHVFLCFIWVSCWMISHNGVSEHKKSVI